MKIILLGGNGYIGREVTRQVLEKAPDAHVTTVSRSGQNKLVDKRVENIATDVNDANALAKTLPQDADCIFCLVGGLGGEEANVSPVRAMLAAADKLDIPVVGCIGGKLGDKDFTTAKAKACELVRSSGKRTVIVEPTLVYGAGRSDKLTKMVPLLKFAGIFNKNVRPMRVEDVAAEIANGIVAKAGEPKAKANA